MAMQIEKACNVDNCAWKSTAYCPFPVSVMVRAGTFSFLPCKGKKEGQLASKGKADVTIIRRKLKKENISDSDPHNMIWSPRVMQHSLEE